MSDETVSILLVEDNPGDAELLRVMLDEAGDTRFVLTHVTRLADAMGRLDEARFDLILLDLGLPDSQELATFSRIHAHTPGTPTIVLSGLEDETVALWAVQEGAQDYLMKGHVEPDGLARTIRHAIARHMTHPQA